MIGCPYSHNIVGSKTTSQLSFVEENFAEREEDNENMIIIGVISRIISYRGLEDRKKYTGISYCHSKNPSMQS